MLKTSACDERLGLRRTAQAADRPASPSSAESGGPHKPGGQAGGGQLATFCLKGVLCMSLGSQIFLYYSGILH